MKEFEAKVRLNEEDGGKTGELDIMLKPPFDNGYFKGVTYGITFKEPVFEAGKSEWIPCSEKLPEPDKYVLVCSDEGYIEVAEGFISTEIEEFVWLTSGWRFGTVIAWMPLPEPYEEEGDEK